MTNPQLLEFQARLQNVRVTHVEGDTILSNPGEPRLEGILSYTEGLSDLLGFELVSYGVFNPEDLLASAELIHFEFPDGIAVKIPLELLREAHPDIPASDYRQFIVNESGLEESDGEGSVQPLWVPDGGHPLLGTVDLKNQIAAFEAEKAQVESDRMEVVRANYRQMIAEYGWAIVGVFNPDQPGDNFAYTVGLTKKELPELIMIGNMAIDSMQHVLNDVTQRIIDDGATLRLLPNYLTMGGNGQTRSLRMVEVDPAYAVDKFLIQAGPILKEPVTRVIQLQISDSEGRFPGDEGFIDDIFQHEAGPVIRRP